MTRLLSIMALCAVVLALPIIQQQSAVLANSDLQYETTIVVPNSGNTKAPKVRGFGDQVYVAGNPDGQASFWSKQDIAGSFSSRTDLGARGDNPNYDTASVAVGTDGTLYYAWINNDDQAIFFTRKAPSGGWASATTVKHGGFASPGAVRLDIGVSSDGKVFIAWFESGRTFKYVVSTNGGSTWSGVRDLGSIDAYLSTPAIATGPNGEVMIAFMGATEPIQVFAGIWNGSDFTVEQITAPDGDYAEPTATIDNNGQYFAAFRSIGRGIYFAARQSNGSWGTARLASGDANNTVAITTDPGNNLHVAWVNNNPTDLYYAFKSPSGDWEGPLRVDRGGREYFAAWVGATLSDRSYGHIVLEQFDGGNLSTRYFRFSAVGGTATTLRADPSIADGATTIGVGSVSVSFTNVDGDPSQLRWRWNAEPTDTENDSGGWQTFANPISIALPTELNVSGCTPLTLYTEVRNDSSTSVASDDITVDGGIQAFIRAVNPYTSDKTAVFTPMLTADSGATDGDPDYTRAPVFYLEVNGVNECSGLQNVAVGTDASNLGMPFDISNDQFANIIPFPNPGDATEGNNSMVIRVTDNVGNIEDVERTFIYDKTKPTLNVPGTLTVNSSSDATIITSLTFSGVNVSDNLYPNGFWGAWIANSRDPITDPLADTTLAWYPVEVSVPGANFTIEDWSLASGLSESELTTGDYYIYVRYLDGASNLTDGWTSGSINLTSVTKPKIYLTTIHR